MVGIYIAFKYIVAVMPETLQEPFFHALWKKVLQEEKLKSNGYAKKALIDSLHCISYSEKRMVRI